MVIVMLISWWYHQGWKQIYKQAGQRVIKVAHLFSLPILIRTLWAPWRRIVTYPGAGLDARLRALGDNIISRAIGLMVRSFVLVTAGIIVGLTAVTGGLSIVCWPLIPPAIIGSVIMGIIG